MFKAITGDSLSKEVESGVDNSNKDTQYWVWVLNVAPTLVLVVTI